jgi:hypothetical protein
MVYEVEREDSLVSIPPRQPWRLGGSSVKYLVLTLLLALAAAIPAAQGPEYSIQAVRFANSPGDHVADMVLGAPKDETIETVYALWLIRGGGRNVLFDSGFHRDRWFKLWTVRDYIRPDEAVCLAVVPSFSPRTTSIYTAT